MQMNSYVIHSCVFDDPDAPYREVEMAAQVRTDTLILHGESLIELTSLKNLEYSKLHNSLVTIDGVFLAN